MSPRVSLSALAFMLALPLLVACGKKAEMAPPGSPAATATVATDPQPSRFKQTEKFGTVSALVLDGTQELPARFDAYQRQVATEWLADEYQKQPDSAFEAYLKRWHTQAASVEKPEWALLAKIVYPESADETNEFKKQDLAEKARKTLAADPASLQMVIAYQAEYIILNGPDVQTGEYYLSVKPGARRLRVGYSDGKHRSNLGYDPDFDALCKDCRTLDFTIKVPLARAREIEALREKGKDMLRFYGRVTGFQNPATAVLHRNVADANLKLEIEAIEMGSRQNGNYQRYFVIGPEQLSSWKTGVR